jgi:hypothetical protein
LEFTKNVTDGPRSQILLGGAPISFVPKNPDIDLDVMYDFLKRDSDGSTTVNLQLSPNS